MRAWWFLLPVIVCALALSVRLQGGHSIATSPPGFVALSGSAAHAFVLPSDVQPDGQVRVRSLTVERYQQRAGPARVLGGQLSLYRTDAGDVSFVIGAHYPDVVTPSPRLRASDALRLAEQRRGGALSRFVELMIDPAANRAFYRVESRNFDTRFVQWFDAQTGALLREYDAIADGTGLGVKGDTKDLTGLTEFHPAAGHGAAGSHYDLFSADGRQETYDAHNQPVNLYYVTDSDDTWDLFTSDRGSPGHPALVDAQYYARVTDDYYGDQHSFDWLACTGLPAMRSVAHYKRNYDNAFWSGAYMVYGDGDGVETREFSGELGVVAHELTHAVTECSSALIYADESGALNEAFSDIIAASVEFYADDHGLDDAAEPDWLVGEDITLIADAAPGFRNMANPAEDGDPDHYTERYVGNEDNGGVHTNSGIANHAYYLLVNGGQNAGCALSHAHCVGEGAATVTGIGLAAAEQIFFLGFAGLPENATMCQARLATEAVAPGGQLASVSDAWRSVGLTDALCGGAPPTATPTPTSTLTPTATATPQPPTATPTSTPTPDPSTDTDGDGCADVEELGLDPLHGGDRDPLSPWDFYDVPVPAGPDLGADGKPILTPASVRNKAVTLADVGVVLAYVGRTDSNPAYTQDNNADGIADGQQLDRTSSTDPSKPWQSGPPNGAISLFDVGVALAQVGHSCAGPP
jgi:Zn-dependent metalloprotease